MEGICEQRTSPYGVLPQHRDAAASSSRPVSEIGACVTVASTGERIFQVRMCVVLHAASRHYCGPMTVANPAPCASGDDQDKYVTLDKCNIFRPNLNRDDCGVTQMS